MAKKENVMGNTPSPAKRKLNHVERFLALSDAEKAAEVAQYDAGFIPLSQTRPLTRAERQSWERTQAELRATHAARQRQRAPTIDKSSRGVQVSIEGGLLADADAFAAAHGLKRAQLFSIGLRLAMAAIPAAQSGLAGK